MFKIKRNVSITVLFLVLFVSISIFSVLSSNVKAQNSLGVATWDRTYGVTAENDVRSLIQTSDGGYAMAGSSIPIARGHRDFWLVKTDADGMMEWNQTYGGDGDEAASSVVQTVDGGYAIAGYSIDFEAVGNGDFWLVKTDSQGVMEWNQTYNAGPNEYPHSLIQTPDGGYVLVGDSYYNSGSFPPLDNWNYDVWLVKTDAIGNLQWNQTYDGGASEGASSLIQTPDGGYALAGYTSSFGVGGSDFWLIKTDDAGNVQWNQTYGGQNSEVSRSLVQTLDGGYALTGYTESFGAGDQDCWLVKTDENGNMEWNQAYGGTETDLATSLIQTSDEGYALAGQTTSFGAGDTDFWLVKTDSSGNIQGNLTYGGTEDDLAFSLVQTTDGGCAIAGYTLSFAADYKDSWLVKIDEQTLIPEFPTWLILPLFLSATLFVVCFKKRVQSLSAT